MPASRSFCATNRLRGLFRLLPLPCANTTRPCARSGISRFPVSRLEGMDR